ncbi:hypothetical protein QF037_007321 [Streptomyces canus]|uniref:glycosyltransferase n=1 Tax=Streptomyces canus TaxID=58343 RepID=UPI002785E18B|nr:glycosyltransferase [Streptomyces canus]MDQ0602976.1 hypothetical protein [Streptomyces canus]
MAEILHVMPPGVCFGAILVLATALWAWFQPKEPHMAHEEAVYANKARSLLDVTPDAGWGIYRPIGLPVLGRIALSVHSDVGALRCVALVLLLFTLTTVHIAASNWLSPRQAILVLLLLLSGIGFLRRTPEYLNDIGATGLLLVVVFLVVRVQEKENSKALLVLPLFVLAAFYLRYGVVGNLLAVAVAAVISYGPRAWAAHRLHIAIAGTVLLFGLLPHFWYAAQTTGSPLGIILSATDQAERAYMGDGLVYYLAIFPYRLAGDLGAVVMTVGILVAGRAAQRLRHQLGGENSGMDDRRRVFLGMSSLLIFVVLGVATDGEPRFVFLPVILLTMLGVSGLAKLATQWGSPTLAVVTVLAAVTIPGTAQVIAHGAMPSPNRLNDSTVPVARALRSEDPCLLVTGYEPTMGWYSGCDAMTYTQFRALTPPTNIRVSLIIFERGRLQPGPASLKRLIGDRDVTVRTIPTHGSIGTATVITLNPGK